jgi:hypothetical protein
MATKRLSNITSLKAKSNASLANRDAEAGLRLEAGGKEICESVEGRSDEGGSGAAGKRVPRQRRTQAGRKRAFLRAYQDNGSETESARLAEIERATHYKWLAADQKYNAAFEATKPMAAGALQDNAIRLATVGLFEPVVYKGQFQYAPRKRTLCLLADGTSVFEDELPKGASVSERRTVMTRDGEMIGMYRPDGGLLLKILAAKIPEQYGTGRRPVPEKYPVKSVEDARASLIDKLNRIKANSGPE